MRQIGTLPDEGTARTFEDFLLTRGVKSNVELVGDDWAIWIVDEDDVEQAREELAEYRENPEAAKFLDGAKAAADLRRQEEKLRKKSQSQTIDMRQRWNRPMSQQAPVTSLLMALSIAVVAVGTNWMTPLKMCDRTEPILTYLYIVPVKDAGAGSYSWFPGLGLQAVRNGQLWRLVTPIFLHFGPLHILFNMLWLRQLGSSIEIRRGRHRFLLLVLTIAVLSNLLQYFSQYFGFVQHLPQKLADALSGGPIFGGMSGVVFGLFGYIWMKSRHVPEDGLYLPPQAVFWMVVWFVICLMGFLGNIANWAHGGGLIVGVAIGYWPVFLRKISGR